MIQIASLMALAVGGAGCSSGMLTTQGAILVTGADNAQGRRIETSTFTQRDTVVMLVDFTWPDPQADGGVHNCEWKWFHGDRLISDAPARVVQFVSTPFTLRTMRAAATLGAGDFKVETLVDNNIVATSRFVISP